MHGGAQGSAAPSAQEARNRGPDRDRCFHHPRDDLREGRVHCRVITLICLKTSRIVIGIFFYIKKVHDLTLSAEWFAQAAMS
jgi:hypothetical protein